MIQKIPVEHDDVQLIADLEWASTQDTKSGKARKSEHHVWDRPDIKLTGWKFNEWDYGKKPKVVLPVDARGLFTLDGKIVIRGYDKFFNINEIHMTSWEWIEQNTLGPYYLTLKENGCIVFLSGLEDGTLLVTSKHATGPREGIQDETNHSWVARKWVDYHLSKVTKTREELAKELYELDVTAVGELCDDSFEEHILPYTSDKAGIYLHGINANCRKFVTYPFQDVYELTDKYGFRKTKLITKDGCNQLKEFLHECSETGSWENDDVEGFVIRCKIKSSGDDFFFKYKFEEPYLMYREWREITKTYLTNPKTALSRIRDKRKQITLEYLKFVQPILDNDSLAREKYLKNHGIISLRQQFLESRGQTGIQIIKEEQLRSSNSVDDSKVKFALIPVATIGCGKTTLAIALCHLTGFGHVQNDNYKSKSKERLVSDTWELFRDQKVVFVDRNNHQLRERTQLIEDISCHPFHQMKYICLNFLPDGISEDIYGFTRARVAERGDNHQTITGLNEFKVTAIMRGFVNRFQPVNPSREPDSLFDSIIDLDIRKGTKENLKQVLEVLREKYNLVKEYSEEQIDEAMSVALAYKPEPRATQNQKQKQKQAKDNEKQERGHQQQLIKPLRTSAENPSSSRVPQIIYFSLVLDLDSASMKTIIDRLFAVNPSADVTFWNHLKDSHRIQKNFHVTLVHVQQTILPERKEVFDELERVLSNSGLERPLTGIVNLAIPTHTSTITVKSLGFDNTAMALNVSIDSPHIPFANSHCHVTIGTELGVPAVKSLEMLGSSESTFVEWNIEPTKFDSQLCVYFA